MFSQDHYRALLTAAGFVRRDDRGRLRLRGTDRRAYLHGLLTNDIASLPVGGSVYAALLTPQGRMIADMYVHEREDALYIDLDRSLAPAIREHLDRFVITEDVTVEDVTDSLVQIGVYGPTAPTVAERVSSSAVAMWTAMDAGVSGTELVVPVDAVSRVESELTAAGAIPITLVALDVTRIEAGIPKFLVDMDTTTIPLEAGIEDRAISMTKGCYVGQEVIVRVLHRGGGRVAKRLVKLQASAPLVAGDHLWSGDREVGRVTSAVDSPRFGPIALAYVQRDFTDPSTPLIAKRDDTEVSAAIAATVGGDGTWEMENGKVP